MLFRAKKKKKKKVGREKFLGSKQIMAYSGETWLVWLAVVVVVVLRIHIFLI